MVSPGGIRVVHGNLNAGEGHLYAHEGGCFLPFYVQHALRKVTRQYPAEQAPIAPGEFYSMFPRRGWAEAMLEPMVGLEHPRVVVDFVHRQISFTDDQTMSRPLVLARWSFKDYLALTQAQVDAAYHPDSGLTDDGWKELRRRLRESEEVDDEPYGRKSILPRTRFNLGQVDVDRLNAVRQ